jgi:thiol-disulfide isomerase/thioredoxin
MTFHQSQFEENESLMVDRTHPTSSRSRVSIWLGIGVAAALAIAGCGGDDSSGSSATTAGPGTTVEGGVAAAEFQPVTVEGTALPQLADGGTDPALGATPPTLSGYSFDGSPITIDPSSGTPTMVVFLAHWCPHCNREVPRLVEWNDGGGVPSDLQIIGVSTAANKDYPNWPPSKWIADEKWPWPVMADSEDQTAAAAYGLPGYPYFVIIGADGTVKARQSGEVEIDDLEQIITQALAA